MRAEDQILIVGSGFAGLTLALFLKRHGIQCRVFEANERPSHLGGTVTMFPNGMRVLRELGVAEEVIRLGATITRVRFRDHSGKELTTSSMGTAGKYGEPTITLRRETLYQLLRDSAAKVGIQIEFGKKVASFISHPDGATAIFSDGSKVHGTCLIGADGINSTIRKSILSEAPEPFYSRLIFFGGFVPLRNMGSQFRLEPDLQEVTVGPVGFIGYSYIDNFKKDDPQLLWYCYLSQKERLKREELERMTDSEIRARVLEAHQGWHSPIADMIRNTTVFCKANVYDMVNLETWSKAKILIIGDAAHAMNPVSGQGASTAMEDGFFLAELLRNKAIPIETIFRKFETARKPRVTKLALKARKSSDRTRVLFGKGGYQLRNFAFKIFSKIMSEERFHWAFHYDVKEEVKNL
ncbi:MAG: FAD-dependent monooxygenase [Bdellovibrionales bacterium]|nr:FAD-dependent monooxygenase [Bdellovibrionales bacterium]